MIIGSFIRKNLSKELMDNNSMKNVDSKELHPF